MNSLPSVQLAHLMMALGISNKDVMHGSMIVLHQHREMKGGEPPRIRCILSSGDSTME